MQYSLDGKTYSTDIPTGTDAGTYTVWYKAVGGSDYYDSEPQSITVTIAPKTVANPTISVADCTYNGQAQEPTVTVKDDLGNIIAPKEYEVSYSDNTNAGAGRVIVTDVAGGNYVIKSSAKGFPIDKAAAPTNIQDGTLNVINGTTLTYTYDFSKLLPELSGNASFGEVSYGNGDVTGLAEGYHVIGTARVNETTGALTLTFESVWSTSQRPGSVGTVSVRVYTQNFKTFLLELNLYPIDQIKPVADGDITATEITYGDALSKSEISGAMKDPTTGETVNGTFAWKDGTITPDAGSYDAEWTFTPDSSKYATVTGPVTVTVEPAELTGVSVRASSTYYTGKPQHASTIAFGQSVDGTTVTFTYSDKVDGDYTSDGPTFTDAGTYTVYYKAEAANHKTATGTFTVTIAPLPISLLSVERISKSYDGTADVTLSASMLTFFSKTAGVSDIKLPDTALTFSDAQFTKKQADGSYLPSPEAGDGKTLSFTMTLASDNYAFEREPEGIETVKCDYATDDTTRFTITKATAPVPTDGTLTIINGLERTYEVDLAALLSALESPKSYGDIAHGAPTITVDAGYCDAATAKIENGKLILPILANPVNTEGNVGSVTVIVTNQQLRGHHPDRQYLRKGQDHARSGWRGDRKRDHLRSAAECKHDHGQDERPHHR